MSERRKSEGSDLPPEFSVPPGLSFQPPVEFSSLGLTIRMEDSAKIPFCPRCGKSGFGICGQVERYGSRKLRFRDSPIGKLLVEIEVARHRFHCKKCNHIFYHKLSAIDIKRRMTQRFIKHLQIHSLDECSNELATRTHVSRATIRRICDEYVDARDAQQSLVVPEFLGVHDCPTPRRCFCSITDASDGDLLDLLADAQAQTLANWLRATPQLNGKVTMVQIEMLEDHRRMIRKFLPNAQIVVRWNCVVELTDQVLKNSIARLGSMPFTVRNGLEKYAPLLFRPGGELTVAERDRVSSVLKRHPALLPYYDLKERLIQISVANTIAEARALFTEWRREIPSSLLSDFQPILLSISAWESELFAYLALGPRVDYVPSLRSFVCETNKEGAGYSLKHLRARLLYSEKALARAKALRLQSSSLRPSLSIDLTA